MKECFEKEGYILLEDVYINSNTKMRFICPIGHEHEITYGKFQSGRRCAYCSNKVKITKEVVESDLGKEGYELIEGFVNTNSKVTLKCPNGHIWKPSYRKFLGGRRCPHCQGKVSHEGIKPTKWDYESVKKVIEDRGWSLLDNKYRTSRIKLNMRCSNGHYVNALFSHFLKGTGCAICSSATRGFSQRKDIKEVDSILKENGYTRLGEYSGFQNKMQVMCNKGHITDIRLGTFNRGIRCKICKMSKGEKIFSKLLDDNSIKYIYEKHEKINGRNYYFDFAIYDNSKLICFIELDGQYHHKEIEAFQTLSNTLRRDAVKNKFCLSNNIPLYRIPYWEFGNLEDILHNKMDEFLYKGK